MELGPGVTIGDHSYVNAGAVIASARSAASAFWAGVALEEAGKRKPVGTGFSAAAAAIFPAYSGRSAMRKRIDLVTSQFLTSQG